MPIILPTFELRKVAINPDKVMQINNVVKLDANSLLQTPRAEMMPATPIQALAPNLSQRMPETRLNKMPGIIAEENRLENCAVLRFSSGMIKYESGDN